MATTRIRIKRGIASAWSSANPVLGAGELGYDTTNRLLKVGDGVTAWNSLPGIDFDGASFDAEDIGFDDSGLTVVEGADVQEALAAIDAELAAASSSYESKTPTVNTVAATGATEALAFGSTHDVTMDQNCTFSFTGAPTSGLAGSMTVIVRGAFTPTWPGSVDWAGGVAPTYTAPAVYTFLTVDGATTVLGFLAGAGIG
jgi:hypothetical protein